MFKNLTLTKRIYLGLILSMVFILLLGSNLLDQRHFNTVQHTVNAVYKDRVVVQDYIYRLNNIFHKEELALIRGKYDNSGAQAKKVEHILRDFKATELTTEEAALLEELQASIAALHKIEKDANSLASLQTIEQIKSQLNGLAQIQLDESGELTHLSNHTLGINSLIAKLEIFFMIVIGLCILALIVYPNPLREGMLKS